MTQKEAKIWMEVKWPLTIVSDRFGGAYSGGDWVAFPTEPAEVPAEVVIGDDVESIIFWGNYNEPYGLGCCPDEAMDNLVYEIQARAEGQVYD